MAGRLGASGLKRQGREWVGPCPRCAGEDRFAIHEGKGVYNCGHQGGAGGDVIALVGHVRELDPRDGRDFVAICEEIVGEPPPGRSTSESAAERAAREARIAARLREAEEARVRREAAETTYRDAEIRRAHEIWSEAGRLRGSRGELYLAARGITSVAGLRLRFVARLGYWAVPVRRDGESLEDWRKRGLVRVAEAPAMVAAIVGVDGAFRGVHLTHLAADCTAKARIVHPESGDVLPAKKVRGSVHGGVIRLSGQVEPARLVIGEGIETVLSVREALIGAERDLEGVGFWSGVSLGNLGGRATETVADPTGRTIVDKAGRTRRARLSGPVPDLATPGIVLPESITEVTILGDGDSDPATTEFATRRAAARWTRPGRTIRRAWARDGADFNDMFGGGG
jgi:hypothetical protein